METTVNVDIVKLRELAGRGFCRGAGGSEDGQVCVRQAWNLACGRGLTDSPDECTSLSVHQFEMRLNDSAWSSPKTRADGMWDLLMAGAGTRGKLDDKRFATRLAELTIRRVLPIALRAAKLDDEAKRCEDEGTEQSARDACAAADAADAACAYTAADAASRAASRAAFAANAAANAAADAANAAADAARDHVLRVSAGCAVQAIREQIPVEG